MLCFVDGWLLYRSSRVVTESGSLESTAIMKYSYVKKKKSWKSALLGELKGRAWCSI